MGTGNGQYKEQEGTICKSKLTYFQVSWKSFHFQKNEFAYLQYLIFKISMKYLKPLIEMMNVQKKI